MVRLPPMTAREKLFTVLAAVSVAIYLLFGPMAGALAGGSNEGGKSAALAKKRDELLFYEKALPGVKAALLLEKEKENRLETGIEKARSKLGPEGARGAIAAITEMAARAGVAVSELSMRSEPVTMQTNGALENVPNGGALFHGGDPKKNPDSGELVLERNVITIKIIAGYHNITEFISDVAASSMAVVFNRIVIAGGGADYPVDLRADIELEIYTL